jgi:hypothetical protein
MNGKQKLENDMGTKYGNQPIRVNPRRYGLTPSEPEEKKTEFKETGAVEGEVKIVHGPLSGYVLRPIGDEYLKKRKAPEGAMRFGLFKPKVKKPYIMMIHAGVVSCSCPVWTRNKDRICKHTRELTDFILGKCGLSLSNLDIEFDDVDALLDFLL